MAAPRPYQHIIVSQGHRAPVAPALVQEVLVDLLVALRAELIVGPIVEFTWKDDTDTLTFTVQAGYWSREDAKRAQDVLLAGTSHLLKASVRRGNLQPHSESSTVEFTSITANRAFRASQLQDA
jgi:hypothetical protein